MDTWSSSDYCTFFLYLFIVTQCGMWPSTDCTNYPPLWYKNTHSTLLPHSHLPIYCLTPRYLVYHSIYIFPTIMNKEPLSEGHKVILFVAYTAGMYLCAITASIFEEKLYTTIYLDTKCPITETTIQQFRISSPIKSRPLASRQESPVL